MRFMLKFVMNTCLLPLVRRGENCRSSGNFRNPARLFGAGLKRVLHRKALFALSCRSMRFLVMKRNRGFLPLFHGGKSFLLLFSGISFAFLAILLTAMSVLM